MPSWLHRAKRASHRGEEEWCHPAFTGQREPVIKEKKNDAILTSQGRVSHRVDMTCAKWQQKLLETVTMSSKHFISKGALSTVRLPAGAEYYFTMSTDCEKYYYPSASMLTRSLRDIRHRKFISLHQWYRTIIATTKPQYYGTNNSLRVRIHCTWTLQNPWFETVGCCWRDVSVMGSVLSISATVWEAGMGVKPLEKRGWE